MSENPKEDNIEELLEQYGYSEDEVFSCLSLLKRSLPGGASLFVLKMVLELCSNSKSGIKPFEVIHLVYQVQRIMGFLMDSLPLLAEAFMYMKCYKKKQDGGEDV